MENNNINTTSNEPVVWPTNTDATKKKQKRRILYLVLAVLLTVSSALGSFYLSKNLNQASTPNAPESEPQAAQKTLQTEANNCQQGCGSDEYCDAGRCRKTGGKADGRTEWEQIVQSIPIATPTEKPAQNTIGYEAIPGYKCTASNCPSPNFYCRGENICVNAANPGLTVANDILNCGGTGKFCRNAGEACIGGQCVNPSTYKCDFNTCDTAKGFKCLLNQCVLNSVGSVTPTTTPRPTVSISVGDIIITPNSDSPTNCGGKGPCSPTQTCISGVCTTSVSGTYNCRNLRPDNNDGAGRTRECCVQDVGIIPTKALLENGDPVPVEDIGKVDYRWHWTNCSPGTSCRQGVGCIGAPTKTPDRTTSEVTTTTTVNPTRIPTATVSPSITTTITVSPTGTVTVTGTPTGTVTVTGTVTATPTIAVCNESCSEDDDCSDGLFCDSESNKCRKPECSDEKDCSCPEVTPEPTIVDCNYKCKTDDNCSSGLICDGDSGRCRKAACSDEKDCSCPKPRKTDAPTREVTTRRTTTRTASQPTVLKEAGILDFPGAAVFGSGLLLTVIGILLAL